MRSALEAEVEGGASLAPGSNPFFAWLDGLRDEIWVDPYCGNGVCEPPYEFPAYET